MTDLEVMVLSKEDFEKIFETEFPYIHKRLL
jgi:hypothetical protein